MKVNPNRNPSSYQLNGVYHLNVIHPDGVHLARHNRILGGGFHLCIGVSFAVQVIADTLKTVYSLKNVRRASGEAGRLTLITKTINDVEVSFSASPSMNSLHDRTKLRQTNTSRPMGR